MASDKNRMWNISNESNLKIKTSIVQLSQRFQPLPEAFTFVDC